jgi:hypothetical protein
MQPGKIALTFFVVLLASCAPARPQFTEVSVPPVREQHQGFSLMPLDESGWLILAKRPEGIVLGKQVGPDENHIIRAFTQVIPPFKSQDEFIGYAKTALSMEDPARHKLLSHSDKTIKFKGQPCVRTYDMMEDHKAVKRSDRSDFMILEASSLVCEHPHKGVAVIVAYSYRYYPGHDDKGLANKAQKIFDSIEFIGF